MSKFSPKSKLGRLTVFAEKIDLQTVDFGVSGDNDTADRWWAVSMTLLTKGPQRKRGCHFL
jgi:hypothetical protein